MTDDLTPTQFAQLRDDTLKSIQPALAQLIADAVDAAAASINGQITDAVTQSVNKQNDLIERLIERMDDLEGRFRKMERADQYAITRRALVNLLEQTDAR